MPRNDPIAVERAREVALRALGHSFDILLASQVLAGLECDLPCVDERVMSVFAGIASETDDLPLGDERRLWAEEALRRKDEEADVYRHQVQGLVIDALQRLLVELE